LETHEAIIISGETTRGGSNAHATLSDSSSSDSAATAADSADNDSTAAIREHTCHLCRCE
jgi:hypothetical protein